MTTLPIAMLISLMKVDPKLWDEDVKLPNKAWMIAELYAIAKMAADGTYIPKDFARAVLERHELIPRKE